MKTLIPAVAVALVFAGTVARADEMQKDHVVTLTQTACQFIESEDGVDRGFKSTSKADCDAINAQSGEQRVNGSKPLVLKPGTYTFRVKNRDVPYELGFWLREADYDWRNPLHKLTKTSVSGGGLTTGTAKDYTVELKPGEYLYSCPLNTTPDYHLIVRE
ncbi:hypothetical protein [Aestuariispira ectoiniformans]|uniref:hypothetical protein n=1 Tax=Aestuariispira ectoiniformans TaxID=2775080 RepID=UPI00223B74B2|nr:hypothetical protein [Aestuariispira ectoiniformans]